MYFSTGHRNIMRVHRNLKPYACCDEHSVIFLLCAYSVLGKCTLYVHL